jgi:hypothetical protein
MKLLRISIALSFLTCCAAPAAAAGAHASVFPSVINLHGGSARQQLLVTMPSGDRLADRTRAARYRCESDAIARVNAAGVLMPVSDGDTAVIINLDGQTLRVVVHVTGCSAEQAVTFEHDVEPILARAGCNAGACHGKARGQNGFALSLLGFDHDFDYHAISHEGRGRRVFPEAPEASLLLRKPSAEIPHGGGRRFGVNDSPYETFRRWIAAGLPRDPAGTPVVERISVEPGERVLANNSEQQIVVTAQYSDGSTSDVTHLATFQSNDSALASVTPDGLVKTGPLPGEAAIMARFMEKFAVCTVVLPMPEWVPAAVYADLPRNNFIDDLVYAKLRRLGLTPSDPAPEHTFLRRAYLDVIGRLPTTDEARDFLADTSVDKRRRLIDRLLERPEYADFWANKWADLLRPNPYRTGMKAVFNLDAWLRDAFRRNLPYDEFVRDILTAKGTTFRNGATVFFRDRREPEEIAPVVSQLFLGVRLDCAKCHHHPFESWSQDDFYSFAAFFAKLGHGGVGLSPPISGGEEAIFAGDKGVVRHPVTGKVLGPRPLGAPPVIDQRLNTNDDPRDALAAWMTGPHNPYFAKVLVNRVWADLMGRGIVDPVDDIRATNPSTNGPLLDALADDFRLNGYDLKKLLRTILSSHVYSLSSLPKGRNAADNRYFSRHYRQRPRAEVLLDAVGDLTGVPEGFSAMPPGTRAMELWTARSQSLFLDSFGRPDPNQDPPCERTSETTVVQALHLMNAPSVAHKLTIDGSWPHRLSQSGWSTREIVGELYLAAFARYPTDGERGAAERLFERRKRRHAIEDLLWALMNTPEFVFKD